jgi:hypothetical protein
VEIAGIPHSVMTGLSNLGPVIPYGLYLHVCNSLYIFPSPVTHVEVAEKSDSRADTWVRPYSWYITYMRTTIYSVFVGRGWMLLADVPSANS